MPQEPKKRHSRQRQGKRRSAIKLQITKGIVCANCGNITIPYIVCKNCGYYKGRLILALKRRKEEKQK